MPSTPFYKYIFFCSRYVPFLNTLIFEDTNPSFEGFLTFWTFVIILQIIIPLSLYVTIEMAKLLQIYLIHQVPQKPINVVLPFG